MRKRNKILMMVISSLLCLTLISSCLVSSVFAKYVTEDTATVPISFKKWGVTITADVRDDLAEIATVTGEDGSATVTISGLKMKPDDDFSDAVRFTITGTPEVKCMVTVAMRLQYGNNANNNQYDAMKIENNAGLEGVWRFMPVGLTFGTGYYNTTSKAYTPVAYSENLNYVYLSEPWRACKPSESASQSSLSVENMRDRFKTGIQSKIDGSSETTYSNYGGITKTFNPTDEFVFHTNDVNGTKTAVNSFVFGFVFPYEYSNTTYDALLTQDKLDEVATYISDNCGKTDADARFKFVVQYDIKIEQVQ